MTDKHSYKKGEKLTGIRPGQDVLRVKGAQQFPSVGVTLPSYKPSMGKDIPAYAPSAAASKAKVKKTPRNKKGIVKRSIIVLLIIAAIAGAWLGGKVLYNAHKLFGGGLLSVLQTTKLKGEDKGRVTILLAGNSADDAGHNGGDLTDSIMVMSVDTRQHKAYMLSIPRDLWVNVPDSGHQKINGAYVVGKANDFHENGFPAGGMGQLEQVVEDNLGVEIDYYALVNYSALKQAVDAVGGIDYTVKSSDPRGLYDPNIDYTNNKPLVKLTNGVHHLNGQQALNLARARGDSSRAYGFAESDFDRTKHQREILFSLKSKAASAGVLSNPAKLSSLFDAIGSNVKTDLSLGEVRRFYDITKEIGSNATKSVSLNSADGVNLLANYQSPNGASALIPAAGLDDFSDIQAFLKRLSSNNPVVQEAAKVVVLNATDTSGLAGSVKTNLLAKNINVTEVGDARANQAVSSIIDLTTTATAKPGTKTLLTKNFGNSVTTTNPYGKLYDADFIVVVGADQIAKQREN
ncbi:LCP family protein [Polaromonas sp.]|nr:LCP family protein [Candidatus Saccharibacteria bacterium]